MIELVEMTEEAARHLLEGPDFPKRTEAQVAILDANMPKTERFLGVFKSRALLGVFGFARLDFLDTAGYCWLVETELVEANKIGFLRACRRIAKYALANYSSITGVCGSDRAIRWLSWVGAEFEPPQNGFAPFSIRAVNG